MAGAAADGRAGGRDVHGRRAAGRADDDGLAEGQQGLAAAPPATYEGAPGLTDYLAQLLPGGRSDHSVPNVFVGVLALLLVASLPFNRRVRPAERIGWYALLLLVGASFVWEPTILLWHGLAIPNGSPYRASFVLSGMLVMAAWASLARRPDVRALLGGAGLVALLALAGHGQSSVRWSTWIEVGAGGALLLGALLALARWRTRPLVRRSAGAVLVLTVFASAAHTAWAVTEIRDRLPFYQPRTTVSAQSTAAAEALHAADDWPNGRTDPGPHEFANNDPLLLGGQGGSYYSSYLPAVTAGMLQELGAELVHPGPAHPQPGRPGRAGAVRRHHVPGLHRCAGRLRGEARRGRAAGHRAPDGRPGHPLGVEPPGVAARRAGLRDAGPGVDGRSAAGPLAGRLAGAGDAEGRHLDDVHRVLHPGAHRLPVRALAGRHGDGRGRQVHQLGLGSR
ncbi:YfhO family protein [Kitasatospora arboriphila]